MKALLEWFFQEPYIIAFLQILLDLTIILFLIAFFSRRSRPQKGIEDLGQSLEKVIEETRAIAEEFDVNLQERQRLIQQVVAMLDQRLDEARQVCQKLEVRQAQAQGAPAPSGPDSPSARNSNTREILRLARKGLDATAIAQHLRKPLGEVELVLSLERLTPGK